MSTRENLITEAARLLDEGGNSAVTLRAVAHAVGVSHNAPYRHFKDRSAILAAIAERDFEQLSILFENIRTNEGRPVERLQKAMTDFIQYGRAYPARYRLLFSDPDIAATEGSLEVAALAALAAFGELVADCQAAGELPETPTKALTSLLYATTHGLIDLQAGGRLREQKGLAMAEQGVTLLLDLLRTSAS